MTKKSKIILGIDPGTRVTGYGLIKYDGSYELLDFGAIRPPAKLDLHKRYLIIFNSINSLIKKFNPTEVAVETQFVKKNVTIAMKLGMARGAALIASAHNDLPIYEYAPRKAKLAVVGNGGATKEQVQKMIQVLLKLKKLPTPEDAADALAIAVCHIHEDSFKQKIGKKNV